MTGYIHITGAEIPEEAKPEGAKAAYGFNIRCDCELDSRAEIHSMVYNLGIALGFDNSDWIMLQMMAMKAGPYNNVIEEHFQIGGLHHVEDPE